MPIANQHSYGLSGDPIQKAVIVQQEKQREEKVERGGTRLKPEQAIQLTAKVLCNSIHNSSSSTPTYTQNRSGFTSPRPGAQFDSSYSIGLVTVILVLFPWSFFRVWLKAGNALCTGNVNRYLGIVTLENDDLMRSQKKSLKYETEFYC